MEEMSNQTVRPDFFKINFYIILPYIRGSSKQSLSFGFPAQKKKKLLRLPLYVPHALPTSTF